MITFIPEKYKRILRPLFYGVFSLKLKILGAFLYRSTITEPKKIPIIINNRNRVTTLKRLIKSLEVRGYRNIHIIDNASTYGPLLSYYRECKYPVYYLNRNVGCLALWETPIHKMFIKDYYVYSDSDVEIVDECPEDFLELFLNEMKSNTSVYKIGLSLKIDDLPDHFLHKQKVIDWERQYFNKPVNALFYEANVDTTLALYRPGLKKGANVYLKMYRAGYPYQARHLPWYVDSKNLSEEEKFYIDHANTTTHWTEQLSN